MRFSSKINPASIVGTNIYAVLSCEDESEQIEAAEAHAHAHAHAHQPVHQNLHANISHRIKSSDPCPNFRTQTKDNSIQSIRVNEKDYGACSDCFGTNAKLG